MKEISQTKVINLSNHLKTHESCWLTTVAYLCHTSLTFLHCIPFRTRCRLQLEGVEAGATQGTAILK
jgi:hypothetical protein